MDDFEMRLRCLEMARADMACCPEKAIIDCARAYADFVTRRNDAEVIRAARQVMGAAHALERALDAGQPQCGVGLTAGAKSPGGPVTTRPVSS